MSRERDEKEMITTLTKGLKGLRAVGVGAFMLALAPDAVADTNDNAYANAMEENNIHSVGGLADLIYAGHQLARRWPCTPADPRLRFTVAVLLLNLRECPETAGYRL